MNLKGEGLESRSIFKAADGREQPRRGQTRLRLIHSCGSESRDSSALSGFGKWSDTMVSV
jgi:hypothetical protein